LTQRQAANVDFGNIGVDLNCFNEIIEMSDELAMAAVVTVTIWPNLAP